MARLKKLEYKAKGVTFTTNLNVSTDGWFSATRPGEPEDWPSDGLKIQGKLAEEVEKKWIQSVKVFSEKTSTQTKVLVVRFDSVLRDGGKKGHFTDRNVMLMLEACIAVETTIVQGDKTTKTYGHHPDFGQMHGPRQPFPFGMLLDEGDMKFHEEQMTVIPWSQEAESMVVRACEGVVKIVELLDAVTATPEALQLAATKNFLHLLPLKTETQKRSRHESKNYRQHPAPRTFAGRQH